MCGIFAYFSRTGTPVCHCKADIVNSAMKIQHRGPDETHMIHNSLNTALIDTYHLVFHRLTINGLSPESSQPLVYPPKGDKAPTAYLMCNGEIYNYKDLIEEYDIKNYHSSSDCEIILHLYRKIGIEKTIRALRGVFAFTILDVEKQVIVIGRDPLGVRSLYYSADHQGYGVCSELKGLYDLAEPSSIHQFPRGSYGTLDITNTESKLQITSYFNLKDYYPEPCINSDIKTIAKTLRALFEKSIKMRLMCDRKTRDGLPAIGAYLSGGFDSSVTAALLQMYYPGSLKTYSIGFAGSPDLKHAKIVAEYIGSEHHEYIITEEFALKNLQEMTQQIESYDVTTNRASLFMYMLSKWIAQMGEVVVLYSGEGADEVSGSYMYFHNAPDSAQFHAETIRLLEDLSFFDLLRGDKSSAGAGLEIRVPFLDIDFLTYYMTIHPTFKLCNGIEKYVLRMAMTEAFGPDNQGRQLLPDSIIWRPKEAMSDGVSTQKRSWSQVIQEYALGIDHKSKYVTDTTDAHKKKVDPVEAEAKLFRQYFTNAYKGCEDTIPYMWLPKWCGDIKDPSARCLSTYRSAEAEAEVE